MKTIALSILARIVIFAGAASAQSIFEVDNMKQQLAEVMESRQVEKANLENFDDLDFNVAVAKNGTNLTKATSRTSSSTIPTATPPRG